MSESASIKVGQPSSHSFFWLCAFYFVYCARPADWIPGLQHIPVAKITVGLVVLAMLTAGGSLPRSFRDLPKEASYMLAMVVLLFASALLSPVWRGGAFMTTVGFAKVYVAWVLAFLLITSLDRLRRIMFIQASSLAAVSAIAILKGHSTPRLAGVIGGIYSNPNDFAFAIVLSLPFCIAFFVSAEDLLRKTVWCVGMLAMAAALLLTGSRAGFIDLAISGSVCLWQMGVKGRRFYLIAGALVVGMALLIVAGGTLQKRFSAISDEAENASAHESYEQRKLLMAKAAEGIAEHPILGVGAGNFVVYSDEWKEVHVSYLQIGAEGGIPTLILFVLFFARGFSNLRHLSRRSLDAQSTLIAGALQSSLVGFFVGACFAPEAYHYFPYFAVCYTSVLFAMRAEDGGDRVMRVRFTSSGHRIVEALLQHGH